MVELRLGPNLWDPLLGLRYNVGQLLVGLPEQDTLPASAVSLADVHTVGHQETVCLAASPRTFKEDLEDRG